MEALAVDPHTLQGGQVTVVVPKLNAVALKGSGDMQLDAFNTPP
jgi:hypothetical protein